MASQPSEDDIQMLMSLLPSADRAEAIDRLKGNNNNLEAAINEYYDNPSSTRYQPVRYDASDWGTDRDGTHSGADLPSFNIDGPDDQPWGVSNAPTRPPSRTSNRSPNKVVDLSNDSSSETWQHYYQPDSANALPADQNKAIGPTFQDQDDDLQRALEMSRQEAGLPPQESGVMDVDMVTKFGPATRDEYDSSQWAMVPTAVDSGHALLFDPEPEYRKREQGKPGFLKPNSTGDRLPAILTVYHEIPLAREILLERMKVSEDYGSDPEWWKGTSIEEKLVTDADGVEEDESAKKYRETRNEIQRLMAFLDKSDRSYASIDALARTTVMQERSRNSDSLAGSFFKILKELHAGSESLKAFLSRGYPDRAAAEESDDDMQSGDWFAVLELSLPNNFPSEAELETSYDLADQLLWDSSGETLDDSAYLHDVGEIVAMRLRGSEASRNVQIPSIWYADRYLGENMEAALEMRQKKKAVKEQMLKIDLLESKLTNYAFPGFNGKTVKVTDLLKASLLHDVEPSSDGEIPPQNEDEDMKDDDGAEVDISRELRRIMKRIDEKLKSFESEREKARESLRELSKLYTVPSATHPPTHKFTLRGVSPSDTVTYICRQAESDLIDMEIDSTTQTQDQWWKLEWEINTHEPVIVTRVSAEEVMAAAESSKDVLVIYASENAMAVPRMELPEPLEVFVERDNELYSRECEEEIDLTRPSEVVIPKSPPKRKWDGEEGRWLGGVEDPNWAGRRDEWQKRDVGHVEHAPVTEPNWGGQREEWTKKDVGHVEHAGAASEKKNVAHVEHVDNAGGKRDIAHVEHAPEPVEMKEREGAPMLGFGALRGRPSISAEGKDFSGVYDSQETVTHDADMMQLEDGIDPMEKED